MFVRICKRLLGVKRNLKSGFYFASSSKILVELHLENIASSKKIPGDLKIAIQELGFSVFLDLHYLETPVNCEVHAEYKLEHSTLIS